MVRITAWLVGDRRYAADMAPISYRRHRGLSSKCWASSAQALGAALIVGAFYGWIGVLRANSFAAVTVRLRKERGQTVISTGPYAVVRHPMYSYAVLLMIGAPLLDVLPGFPSPVRVRAMQDRIRVR